ncbi:hypothetical protein LW139_15730 [Proteus vulgaris]|uniref:hypothetical protein n=1 Tax=Proteus vulgaris TaxID=585 RepID=UPI001FFF97B8|nr:hypothetical protein [Proteus vulgaris]UPK80241.1 hypothetical protein LW139_15730 [Proteus vulgaris]
MMLSESIKKDLIEERKRILSPCFEKDNNNFIMRYTTYCNEKNSSQIANIAKNILLLIQKYSFSKWPTIDEWYSILPKEFINSFLNSTTPDDWSLDDWLYWLEPENRFWFLWRINEIDIENLEIEIIIYEHPYPWESLEVLFMKLGTSELKEVDSVFCLKNNLL